MFIVSISLKFEKNLIKISNDSVKINSITDGFRTCSRIGNEMFISLLPLGCHNFHWVNKITNEWEFWANIEVVDCGNTELFLGCFDELFCNRFFVFLQN